MRKRSRTGIGAAAGLDEEDRMGIREVARAAHVSVTTASRALNGTGRVAETTRDRVRSVADELGYRPNELARQLKRGKSSSLGIVVPDITNPFFSELAQGVQEAAARYDAVLLLTATGADPSRTAEAIAQMRARHVAGVVLVEDRLDDDRLVRALDGMRFVALDRELDPTRATSVTSDHRSGGRMAVQHLVDLGHRRIAHVAGRPEIAVARERSVGYHEGLAAAGVDTDPALVVEADFEEEAGYRGTLQLLDRGTDLTAVFAVNDLAAIGAVRALDERGLSVPRDVSVVGFDDIHLASYVRPGLTTIHQQIDELGRQAAELLLDDKEGRSRMLDVHVVTRGTTAPPPSGTTPPGRTR
ncbi:LacI family DNA-binding transcriptional regulator [Georgenia sp. Z1491]|uniref:LacI family DNA-binding transcriptional regulator n=1 Tax=Georgenia sp. Z1491 TaxID=3416707 RepID=UPI003CF30E73